MPDSSDYKEKIDEIFDEIRKRKAAENERNRILKLAFNALSIILAAIRAVYAIISHAK